jgi:SNF2 family DNA or RNA helicase
MGKRERERKMRTTLMPFQRETVDWMKDRKGGLIYHEQGLGKTICVIDYLISTNQWKNTLIVCPSSLIDMWRDQIIKHSNLGLSDIGIYHKSNRNDEYNKYSKDKLYISSYSILSIEYKKILNNLKLDEGITADMSDCFLHKHFKCIILDEAHNIRNRTAQSSMSICNLLKTNQLSNVKWWIVTATPIVNKVDDIYPHFRLLDINGIETIQDFRNIIPKSNKGLGNANEIIKQYGIRYMKKDVLEQLEGKNESVVELEFNKLEQDFYNSLYEYSKMRIIKLSRRTLLLSNNEMDAFIKRISSMVMITLILRLKQCCNSPNIVISSMKKLSNKSIKEAIETLDYYNENKSLESECIICLDKLGNTIIDPCGHKVCDTCRDALYKYKITSCPMCRSKFTTIRDIKEDVILKKDSSISITESTKVKKLFEIIKEKIKLGEKIVIVSQWVTMLNSLSEAIECNFNEKVLILSGEYSIKERHSIVEKFQNDKKYKIILISLNSSSEGITLTAAQTMVHLDIWWNKAKEEQVTDRIHRIGQEKTVEIIHLRIKGSIEGPISKLVKKKKKISETILSKEAPNKIRIKDDSWMEDIVRLIIRS